MPEANLETDGQALDQLEVGRPALISALPDTEEHFLRLRAMGLCEGRLIETVQLGSRLIVRVGGTRIGLDRQLARRIQVRPQ